jgi:hypothetical protein
MGSRPFPGQRRSIAGLNAGRFRQHMSLRAIGTEFGPHLVENGILNDAVLAGAIRSDARYIRDSNMERCLADGGDTEQRGAFGNS